MRDHVGRHDGCVQGHRYFTCRGTKGIHDVELNEIINNFFQTLANRGIMVRPSSVTVRGINGATLIKPE